MPHFRRWGLSTLRVRLLLLTLLAVLPAIAVIVDTGFAQRRQAAHEAQASARRLAQIAAHDHAHFFQEGRQLLTALAEIPEVRDASPGSCPSFLGRLAQVRNDPFANFGVIRPNGEIVCSGSALQGRINVSDRAYFRRAIRTRAFAVGDYQIGRLTGIPVVVLAEPTYNAQGALRSIVFTALDLAWFNRFAAQADLPPGSSLTVLDAHGTVLVRAPDSKKWVGKQAPESSLLHRQAKERNGVTEAPGPNGKLYLYALAHLSGLPGSSALHVVVGIPAREAYAPADRLLVRNLWLLGVVLGFVMIVAWIAAEVLILRRTNRLVSAAQRLAAGDLAARTGIVEGRDELSAVAATFDRMGEALEQRAREMAQHAERIARLNRVYAVLSGINGAILRIREREELLKEACRIAVEHGQFRLAWIGLLDDHTDAIRPLAWAGQAQGYLEDMWISIDPNVPEGHGPAAIALREGRSSVCNDIERDPCMAPWREKARVHGFAASAAFPLRIEGRVVGALNLYAGEVGFFNGEELRLLEELAADTSLGMEHVDQNRRIHYLAYHDPVTGLPNINLFLDRLTQAIARARHHKRVVAVVAFDIGGYLETLGAVGRHAGDRMLRAAGEYLAAAVREGDAVARLEGHEFGVVLADVARPEDAIRVAEKLAGDFPGSMNVADEEVFLRAHAGMSLYPSDGADADALLKHARLAVRAAATPGAEPVSFYARGLNETIQERRRIERALSHALERGELALHYQPVVELATRRIVGLEALARWTHPELGPVSPATFIPIAEETGLILALGEWVLRRASRQCQLWRAQGLQVGRIAVNVSARQLRDRSFVERVRTILEEAGIAPANSALALEVTESELMDNMEAAVLLLRELKGLGLAIYVDDFGTGYSSLAYLQKLPIDTLKIDQRFVRELETSAENVAIVKTILVLARALNLHVIAEGVETEGQLALLRGLGCNVAQGFLLSKPLPAQDVSALLERGIVSA